jgi:hypothetical protein
MKMYIAALIELEPNRWVATSDADDVLCVRSLTSASLESLTESKPGSRIVASAETVCHLNCVPLKRYWRANKDNEPRNGYTKVNAGGLIGRAKDLLTTYTWMMASGELDDQRALGKYMNLFPERVLLDSYATELAVVDPSSGHKTSFISESYAIQRPCGVTKPALLHFPGKLGFGKLLCLAFGKTFTSEKDEFGRILLQEHYIEADSGLSFAGHMACITIFVLTSLVVILLIAVICLKVQLSGSRARVRA